MSAIIAMQRPAWSRITTAAAAILLSGCFQTGVADFRTGCDPSFAEANMDPIVAAGTRSSHPHHISGSLGFSDVIDKAKMINAETTCDLIGDFSNYWTPVLYRTDTADGTPVVVPTRHHIYYRFLKEFPISATVLSRPLAYIVGKSTGATENEMYPHIRFYVVNKGGDTIPTDRLNGWPTKARNVVELQIDYIFPSCLRAGDRTFSPEIMAYPDPISKACPKTHQIRVPQAQIEARYTLSPMANWTDGSAPFFLSSGYMNTAHADGVFLFNATVLDALMRTCQTTDVTKCRYTAAGLPRGVPLGMRKEIATHYTVPNEYLPDGVPPAPAPTPLAPTSAPTKKPTVPPSPMMPVTPPTAQLTPLPTAQPALLLSAQAARLLQFERKNTGLIKQSAPLPPP